jgi:hypothetical protein
MPKDHEYKDIIAATYRIVQASERRFDALRDTDRDAVRLAHEELTRRLEGFPQQFATKVEMEEAARAVQRLEKESVSRELYEQRHDSLAASVAKAEREKLDRGVFDTFVENYRREQALAVEDRRNVVNALSTATDAVREQFLEERNEFLTVEAYDQRHQVLVHQVDAVERWQYKLVGGLVFATFVAPLVTGVVVYFITKGLG